MVTMHKPRQLRQLGPRVREAGRPGATERIRGSALQTIRDRILSRDAGMCRCAECQRTGDVRPAAEVEHRRPLWEGGREDDGNRYAIARECHLLKTRCEDGRRLGVVGWRCVCRRCLDGA